MGLVVLPGLSELPLHRLGGVGEAAVHGDGVSLVAGPRTDWFIDPRRLAEPVLNAPALVGSTRGDFLLGARVTVEFGATFDAGALVVWGDERCWAKLCFEVSPEGEPMVVSVVTRGVSDDCNSFSVDTGRVWLRIARLGAAFAFHASTDGNRWRLVRHFALDVPDELRVGLEAQSPLGDGCTARFTELRFERATLADIRNGG